MKGKGKRSMEIEGNHCQKESGSENEEEGEMDENTQYQKLNQLGGNYKHSNNVKEEVYSNALTRNMKMKTTISKLGNTQQCRSRSSLVQSTLD